MNKPVKELKFLGIEPLENDYTYEYKRKVDPIAINVNDIKTIEALVSEADALAGDPNKNEKVAIQFLTINKNPVPPGTLDIIDSSAVFDKTPDNQPITGAMIKEFIAGYTQYVQEQVQTNYPGFELQLAIVKMYSPLDKKNKEENIPDLGHLVDYYKSNAHGSFNISRVDCRKEVQPVPNFNLFNATKNTAQRIQMVKNSQLIDNKGHVLKDFSSDKKKPH